MPNIERLNQLIRVLEEVQADPKKARGFDMSNWAKETDNCGTHACACGWAAMDPWFKAQGLRLNLNEPKWTWQKPWNELAYEDKLSFQAAAAFFEISARDADVLFDEYSYDKEDGGSDDDSERVAISAVIDRVKAFIAEQS